jgi:plasmid stability protein
MRYTIRNIPKDLDRALRDLARSEGKSLNAAVIDALRRATGAGQAAPYHDLDWAFGRWVDDPSFDAAIAEQDQVDDRDWRRKS